MATRGQHIHTKVNIIQVFLGVTWNWWSLLLWSIDGTVLHITKD